jgi:putative transposase
MKNNEIPLFPGRLYHIYNHANGKENLFTNSDNYLFFLKRYQYFIEPIAETFAYCLMPNHLHVLVRIKSEANLQQANRSFLAAKNISETDITPIATDQLPTFISKTFGNLFSSYSQAFNKQQKRRGSLFMPNFKRKEIDSEHYYTKLIHYIHNNPVHHGFVAKMEDWTYSSYNAFLSNQPTKIVKEEVVSWFGSKQAFINYHLTEQSNSNFEW